MEVTITLDDDLARKVELVAADRGTSVAALIQEWLRQLKPDPDVETCRLIKELRSTFERYSRPVGPRTWTRADLHDRL